MELISVIAYGNLVALVMGTSRRRFLADVACLAAAAALPGCTILAKPPTISDLPNPATFEPGDFLWPKPPGTIIPYQSGAENVTDESAEWVTEKRQFIELVRTNPTASVEDREAAARLEDMTFATFKRRYLLDAAPDTVDPFGSLVSLLPVAHVGIIFFPRAGDPWVAEAVPPSVHLRSYPQWLAGRPDEIVWHGRLSGIPREQRALIAAEAIKYKGRPYHFFNFHLTDITGFYCSKLVWLSTYRALGLALDNDANPRRRFWFSPKQLMKSPHVCLLYSPETLAPEARECAQFS
jgi:Permuted papain-like amidase enzyme, YaeF/YiiX, C92 family